MNKLYEYKEAYFLTADDDLTCLLAHSMLKNTAAHFIHSPALSIRRFSRLPIFQTMLRVRTVFTVSKFAQRELQRTLNLHALVWPPFIDSNRFRFSRTNKRGWKIGYYSAGPHKGDNIINALATKMPDQQFIIIGRGYHPDVRRVNVNHLGGIADLKSFYAEISLLLVPSLIPEGFSRVVMEASMNAIPVIGNKIGGIPEALGPSGILIDTEASEDKIVGKYVSAITRLVSDPVAYDKYSKKAVERAQEYEKELYQTSVSHSDIFLRKISGIPDDNNHQTEFRSRPRRPCIEP
jgi:glycosyltransferase involved in cell wall biosynthesis